MVLIRAAIVALATMSLIPGLGVWSAQVTRSPGAIRGKVDFRRGPASVRRPGIADLGAAPARFDERGPAVVYLESAPAAAFEERANVRARMDQKNETFVPHVLAVTAGTSVDFPNSDRTYHNVFSYSSPNKFELGRYAAGRSKSVRFEHPGIVRVFCDIHSHMNAYILVFSHRFFAMTDAEGRYRIDRVPPGTYAVVAWVEGDARERQVVVPEGGVVEADFSIR